MWSVVCQGREAKWGSWKSCLEFGGCLDTAGAGSAEWLICYVCRLPLTSSPGNHGQILTSSTIFHFLLCDARELSLSFCPHDFSCLFSVLVFLLLVFLPVCSHHLKKVACFCRSWINIITQSWVCLNSHQYGKHEHTYTHSSVRTVLSSSTKSYKFMMTGCEFKRERDTNFFFCTVKSTMASRRNRLESGALLWLL